VQQERPAKETITIKNRDGASSMSSFHERHESTLEELQELHEQFIQRENRGEPFSSMADTRSRSSGLGS
jgi:hypothetical protein